MLRHLALFACAGLGLAWPTDTAFFPHHPSRRVQVLNGTWAFALAPAGTDAASVPYSAIATSGTADVPSCFDIAAPGIKGFRGTAFYRSTHTCTPGTLSLLRFMAVNFYARVFVDGVEVGEHTAGPYTPFDLVAPACSSKASRELVVIVNNEFNATLSPTATGGDFYAYGGIIRPVIVSELPAGSYYVDRVEPITMDVAGGLIDVRVVLAANKPGGPLPSTVSLTLAFNGGAAGATHVLPVVQGVATLSGVAVPDAKPWSLGHGNLFTLTANETRSGDAITVRSGLRLLGVTGSPARLTINGEVIKLRGFNRHTMWPDTGAAVTLEQEAIDLALVQGVNANYIRGGHYPQSQSWLDALDAAGIAIWEEALGPGVKTSNIEDPVFMAAQVRAVKSMVESSIAHPAVFLHGFFNEGPSSDTKACPGYATLASEVHAHAPLSWRMATWASDKTTNDVCYDAADVISFNNYPGWYGSPGDISNAATTWKRLVDWWATSQFAPTKPFTVSETGGGGVYEWVNETVTPPPFWSQAYQRDLTVADATYLVGDARVTGVSLWLLTDFKVDDESCGQCVYEPHPDDLSVPWNCSFVNVECGGGASCLKKPCGRPGGENHKGTVDFWRRKKLSYPALAAVYA